MSEQDSTKNRLMNNVRNLLKPQATAPTDDGPDEIDPSDAPLAIHSPKSNQIKGRGNIINNNVVGPWLIVLTAVSAVAITLVAKDRADRQEIFESKIQAAVAQAEARIRIDVADEIAKANATAHVAQTQALVALDKVEDMRVKLAQKGIKILPLDGH